MKKKNNNQEQLVDDHKIYFEKIIIKTTRTIARTSNPFSAFKHIEIGGNCSFIGRL